MDTDVHGAEMTRRNAGSDGGRRMSPLRMAAWAAAALLLLLPLVAMRFDTGVNWTAGDFAAAAVLLFGSLGAYEVAARRAGSTVYRAGVGLAIAATLLLLWGNGALSVTDSDADVLYDGVAAIGLVGVLAALVRPRAGAFAMATAALGMVGATVATLAVGLVPNPYVPTFQLIGLTGFYAALFVGAAWLLLDAAGRYAELGAA